jgi:hypothetical protein
MGNSALLQGRFEGTQPNDRIPSSLEALDSSAPFGRGIMHDGPELVTLHLRGRRYVGSLTWCTRSTTEATPTPLRARQGPAAASGVRSAQP